MTPLLKTGIRKYQIHYSRLINGERHEKQIVLTGQNEKFVSSKLKSSIDPDLDLEIHSITRIS